MSTIDDLRAQIAKAQMEISTKRAKNTNVAKNLKRKLAQELTKLKVEWEKIKNYAQLVFTS